jgi:dTDP-4-amino-4,6-dideoxygalactose transaminase
LNNRDEVIIPSFNFTSGAIAIVNYRATPVFVDISPITKCIDTNQIERAITSRTRAISWVNYAGTSPDLEQLRFLAKQYNLYLIEDNAHCLGNQFEGNELGHTGDFVTYSFHATKNFQCGEGGAITFKNNVFVEEAQIMREKGTNRAKYLEGKVDKYTWVGKGSSHLLSEVQAAVLLGQLENYERIQKKRVEVYRKYVHELRDICQHKGISGSFFEADSRFAAHLFYLQLHNREQRSQFTNFMSELGITCVFHYQALHTSSAGIRFGKVVGSMKQTEKASDGLVRLPLFFEMTDREIDRVISGVRKFIERV